MTRRLLTDPLLWLLVVAEALVQAVVSLPGDTVETVDGVVRTFNALPVGRQLGERLLVALLVALPLGLLPVLARRSHRRWRGRSTRRGGLAVLWDAPWHRDPVLWTAGALASVTLFALGVSSEGTESSGPDQATRSTETVTGSWLDVVTQLPLYVLAFLVLAVAGGVVRLVFRLLGGERPWRRATVPPGSAQMSP